ncbi:MAG: hypothetical protein R3F49_07280 [Planctomycetota bacterium]
MKGQLQPGLGSAAAAVSARRPPSRVVASFVALTLLGLALEWIVTGRPLGGGALHPHPYWVIVLPLAAAHGIRVGVLAAVTAIGLYLAGLVLAREPVAFAQLFDRDTLSEPVLFLAAAVILGEVRYALGERLESAFGENRALRADVERLASEREVLLVANSELTRRIAVGETELDELLLLARRLRFASRASLLTIAVEFASDKCGGRVRLLAPASEGERLEVVAQAGVEAQDSAPLAESLLVKRCLASRSTRSSFTERLGAGEPLVAAPLLDFQRNVVGILALDAVPAERLRTTIAETLGSIADWISSELQDPGRDLRPSDSARATTSLASPQRWTQLVATLRFEAQRRVAQGIPAQVITFSAPPRIGLDEGRVARAVAAAMGDVSGLFRFCYQGTFAVVLPGAEYVQAERMASVLEQSLFARASGTGDMPRAFVRSIDVGEHVDELVREISRGLRERSPEALEVESLASSRVWAWGDQSELSQWLIREATLARRFVETPSAVAVHFQEVEAAREARLRLDAARERGEFTGVSGFAPDARTLWLARPEVGRADALRASVERALAGLRGPFEVRVAQVGIEEV